MTTKGITINWVNNHGALSFTFPEVLDKKSAEKAIAQWDTEFASLRGNTDLIWDCSQMNDYDPVVRIIWQKALSSHKDKIDTIWMVCESAVVRAGAKLFSLFVGVKIKTVKTLDEIPAFTPMLAV